MGASARMRKKKTSSPQWVIATSPTAVCKMQSAGLHLQRQQRATFMESGQEIHPSAEHRMHSSCDDTEKEAVTQI